ncbi:5'-nucleotidase SurE [Candidatus Xenohaliotis californiensis]|uniref:5'-nucleotidase SurE n=1 Tax=Candidatus Xenohaliotis californiensis TaxID=84677 RepID=A0ABM9N8I8_9RICK|nr:5'-nucleotidase SurE [Candidatus Xenohaliotis californiensis]
MRILVSNDDGIDSEGIDILTKIAKNFSNDVWVVAPAKNCSAASRSLTIKEKLTIKQLSMNKFTVDGTPIDCLLAALYKVMPEKKPDLVLSGINSGANLAMDIGYSGTVGIAIESMLQGINSIAISQEYSSKSNPTVNWDVAHIVANNTISALIPLMPALSSFPKLSFNVNIPHRPKGIRATRHAIMIPTTGLRNSKDGNVDEYQIHGGAIKAMKLYKNIKSKNIKPYKTIPKNETDSLENLLAMRINNDPLAHIDDNSDLATVSNGYVSVTPLSINMNNNNILLNSLSEQLTTTWQDQKE